MLLHFLFPVDQFHNFICEIHVVKRQDIVICNNSLTVIVASGGFAGHHIANFSK